MTLEEAIRVVEARSLAAVAGAGRSDVETDAARMLLSGVDADADQVLEALLRASNSVVHAIKEGHPGVAVLRGVLLETFVLGALVGSTP